MKKTMCIVLTLIMLLGTASAVFALPPGLSVSASMIAGADTSIKDVLGVIQWVGYAFAIGMLIYIGIKYMMSAANEKADLKKGLINYVIGAILIAATVTISGWIINFGQSLRSAEGGAGGNTEQGTK